MSGWSIIGCQQQRGHQAADRHLGGAHKVEVNVDRITTVGAKLQLTGTAEGQAGTGHDMMTFLAWDAQSHASRLEPVDDIMGRLIAKYGPQNEVCQYLGQSEDHWVVIPSSFSSQYKGPCGRISLLKQHAGLNVTAMFPARPERTKGAEAWTYDAHLKAAAACQKAGFAFGIGLSTTPDWSTPQVPSSGPTAPNWSTPRAKLRSIRCRAGMPGTCPRIGEGPAAGCDQLRRRVQQPRPHWRQERADLEPAFGLGGSETRCPRHRRRLLDVSGPKRSRRSFTPFLPFHWGIWRFSANKAAAKELLEWLMQREQIEQRCVVSEGYDIPPFPSMADFTVWADVEPPKGTVYNYILRPHHHSTANIAGFPAPPEIGVQIYNRGTAATMFSKLQSGQSISQVVDWAKAELEGFVR